MKIPILLWRVRTSIEDRFFIENTIGDDMSLTDCARLLYRLLRDTAPKAERMPRLVRLAKASAEAHYCLLGCGRRLTTARLGSVLNDILKACTTET